MLGSIQALVPRMRDICGAGNVITDPLELRTYECDGLTAHRSVPALVVLPSSAAEVALVVASCAAAKVPFVARGSGTGLSGGALFRHFDNRRQLASYAGLAPTPWQSGSVDREQIP